jgi:hypothetical protein
MKTRTRKSKKMQPFVLMVCFLVIFLSPLLLFIPKKKRVTEAELLAKYPRMNNGVSMTECRRILNKNGVFYTDEEIERMGKVMELLAEVYYQQTRGRQQSI